MVQVIAAAGERSRELEAEAVVARMLELREQEAGNWGDFAILVRALGWAEDLEELLERRGIPFLVSGGRTFLETRETLDLIGLVATLANPCDEIAAAGVLRGPLAGWSDEQLLRAGREGRLQAIEKSIWAGPQIRRIPRRRTRCWPRFWMSAVIGAD